MNSARVCPKCAKPLVSDAPEGLCAECLLKAALANPTDLGPTVISGPQGVAAMPPTPNHGVGSQVRYFGDYELLEEIARGGMGVVHKARQVNLKRVVALKMILAGQLAGDQEVKRFRAEAEAAAHLDHPNIVPIYEIGQHDRQHYFSMAFVEGRSLAHKLSEGVLTPREAVGILLKVTKAIAYAHAEGVVHRDLKPGNILIDQEGEPRITDFGLAKRVEHDEQLTATGQVLGTPSFMPPEQAAGDAKRIGPAADIYALGAVLYCLLTGRPPFQAASPIETLLQVTTREPVSPRQLNAAVPRDLETVCLKCLEKEPARRYGSAQELADELQRFLDDRPIKARPIPAVARAWRWCRRSPVVAGLAASVVAVLALGTIISSYFAIQANEKATLAQANEAVAKSNAERADREAAEAAAHAKEARQQTEQAVREKERADANAIRFGRDLYVLEMKQVQQAWEEGRIYRALELLDSQRPERTVGVDLRGFEWHYWKRLCHTDLRTFDTYGACSVAYSPDGRLMAWGGSNYNVQIWDVRNERILFNLKQRHSREVWCVVFSPDSTRLASATGTFNGRGIVNSEIKIWDTASGKELVGLKAPDLVTNLAYSADGKRLASAHTDQTVTIWDASTGDQVFDLNGASVCNGVSFSPDGKQLACAYETGAERHLPGDVKVWEIATRQETLQFKPDIGRLYGVAFSPDGKRLAVVGDRGLKVCEPKSGKELHSLSAGTGRNQYLAFNRDGSRLAAGYGSIVKVWDAITGQEVNSFRGGGGIVSVAFSPDGKQLASADESRIKVWDLGSSQQPLAPDPGFSSWFTCTAFSPDGKYLAAGGSVEASLVVWDARSGKEAFRIKASDQKSGQNIWSVAFSPDGTRLAAAGEDKTLRVWNIATRQAELTLTGHTTQINGIAFSPNGKRIASVSGDHQKRNSSPEIKVWDATSGAELLGFTGNSTQITSIAYSPDGQRLAGGITQYGRHDAKGFQLEYISGEVQVWDAETGRELLRLKDDHEVKSVRFSPDGTRIAAGGLSYGVKVWDATTGRRICAMKGHTSDVNGIAFSPDGKRIASASEDLSVRVWDATTGQEALIFRGFDQRMMGVGFSPDGTQLAAVGGQVVRIWDASPPTNVTIGVDGTRLNP